VSVGPGVVPGCRLGVAGVPSAEVSFIRCRDVTASPSRVVLLSGWFGCLVEGSPRGCCWEAAVSGVTAVSLMPVVFVGFMVVMIGFIKTCFVLKALYACLVWIRRWAW
jgi:hypothetical protein